MKKKYFFFLLLILFGFNSNSQSKSGFFGKIISAGLDYSILSTKTFDKANLSDEDQISNFNYLGIGPAFRIHFPIKEFTDRDILFLNLNQTFNFLIKSSGVSNSLNSTLKDSETFGASCYDVGLTYLGGDYDGKAMIIGVLGSYVINYRPKTNIIGATLYGGFQFELSERVFQIYAKNTFNFSGRDYKKILGLDYYSKYNANLLSFGMIYKGIL